VITLLAPSGKAVEKNVPGRYTQRGPSLGFSWKGAGKTTGAIDGKTLTMINEGMNFTYQRRDDIPILDPR
jgi:hypothetical protein